MRAYKDMYKRSAPPAFIVGHFVVFAVCICQEHIWGPVVPVSSFIFLVAD